MRITPKLIDATETVLRQVLTFQYPADAVLSHFFREQRILGRHDRGFIAEAVYAVLRRRRLLEHLIGTEASPRRLVLAALVRIEGISQRQLIPAIGEQDGGWLAALKADNAASLTPAEQADFPDWLAERLERELGVGAMLELARGLNQAAPLDLRVNPLKASREAALARLNAEGIEAHACPYAPLGIRLKGKLSLQRHPLYLSGEIEVQDEGSQLLAHLLAPRRGEMVVDFCAGAGGKTLLLGALMRSTGRLYAFDVAEKRLSRLRTRVARAGLSNVHVCCISSEHDPRVKRLAGKIDRVLADVPCSGLGTLRRNPDLKWRQSAESVTELARKQFGILGGAARLVKPGGCLVYATCSILGEENEEIVDAFLSDHPDYEAVPAEPILTRQNIPLTCGRALRLTPHEHNTDGFYATVLARRK